MNAKSPTPEAATPAGANRALFLSTVAFALAFAVWGLLSGLAPLLKQAFRLSQTQVSLMVAIPVLLGSVGRLPMGLLADRIGARGVMAALLGFVALPAFALGLGRSYPGLLLGGFFLGAAGTAFSVGVVGTSPWFPQRRQGAALGLFGLGTGGQSIAVFCGPLLATRFGMSMPFFLFGALSLAWAIAFGIGYRDAPRTRPPTGLAEALRPLRTAPLAWLFSFFYFLTFGGFVAMGVYLPSLLKEVFSLSPADAGARAAGFVVVATAARPLGGWLSDRIGGEKLLSWVFPLLGFLALGLASPSMPVFTLGALGSAMFLGLGNGAVFKLVPQHFPGQVGTVTGLVGAAGGLGGFFPPLLLGLLRDAIGSFAPGFVLLSLTCFICLLLELRLLGKRPPSSAA